MVAARAAPVAAEAMPLDVVRRRGDGRTGFANAATLEVLRLPVVDDPSGVLTAWSSAVDPCRPSPRTGSRGAG